MNSYLVSGEKPQIGQFVVDKEGNYWVVCMKYSDGNLVVSPVTVHVRFNAGGVTKTKRSVDVSVLREVTVRQAL